MAFSLHHSPAVNSVKQLISFTILFFLSLAVLQTLISAINTSSSSSFPTHLKITLTLIPPTLILIFIILRSYFTSPKIYMVDFTCYKPPSFCRVPFAAFIEGASILGYFSKETISTMSKIFHISGVSQETHLPPALHFLPPRSGFNESVEEFNMVIFSAMQDLLSKTRISPQDIDILIVNCSGFCPSPSLSSIIINKFKLRDDVKSYSLSGMGCSASIAAIDTVKNLLTVHMNQNAVILSTEILTTGWYGGDDPSMLTLNCLFRMGGAAILLTNKPHLEHLAKYQLIHSLRTHIADQNVAYYSAYRDEDSDGKTGFRIDRVIIKAVSDALRAHITILGSQILPLREKLRYVSSLVRNKLASSQKGTIQDGHQERYVPNFKTVINHFILPTSGRPWVKEIGKGLRLNEDDLEPALMTFHRFGNQSSSSLWYELAYLESKQRVEKGDMVWQMGLGSGMKCCSAIWKCTRPIICEAHYDPWADCIDRYPVSQP